MILQENPSHKIYPTITQLFEAITQVSANGLRFEFEEICKDGLENNEVLVFVPQLSILKIKFKKELSLPTVQFETPRDYY